MGESYHALPATARDSLILSWSLTVNAVATQSGGKAVQPMLEQVTHDLPACMLSTNTIVCLQCQICSQGAWRKPSIEELRLVHRLMALDLCDPSNTLESEAEAALSHRCFIAQPVALGKDCAPVLRVAVGAPQVVDAYEECLRSQQQTFTWPFRESERIIILKLASILANWDEW